MYPGSSIHRIGRSTAVSFVLVAVAAGLRLWPLATLGPRLAWLTFYPAVMVAALQGGLVSGLLGTLLSCLTVIFLLPGMIGQSLLKDSADWIGLAVFVLTSSGISVFAEAMHRARHRERQAWQRSAEAEAALARLNAGLETEVRERTAALRESEERFRLLVDGVKDYAVLMLDPAGRVLTWNLGAERLKGYSADEILGSHFSRFYPPEDVADGRPDRELARAGSVGRFEEEGWRVRKDGGRFWANVVLTALHDKAGHLRGFAKITRDISERRQAEAEREKLMADLRQAVAEANRNRAQLETVFQAMQDGIVVFDPAGNAVLINEAEARINGFATAEEMKRDLAYFAQIYELAQHDGTPLPVEQWPVSRIMRGETLYDLEARGRRKDTGREWFFSFSGAPIYDEQGRLALAVTITRDITRRKQAEDELHELNASLERRVTERTAQLETANRELEAFSYSVSHDLRAPLRHIDGFAALLRKNAADRLDDKGRRHLEVISDAARQMGRLIDDLLSFSRMSRVTMHPGTVDQQALVTALVHEGRYEQTHPGITWRIAGLPPAHGDGSMLRLVWMNLIDNAVKYTGKTPHPCIEIGSRAGGADGEPVCFVRDNGAGFDPRYTEKLFGVFQRLHSAAEFEGTGIGLANVRRIISRHGGRTWAEGAVGQGATFYFSLPASTPAPAAAPDPVS